VEQRRAIEQKNIVAQALALHSISYTQRKQRKTKGQSDLAKAALNPLPLNVRAEDAQPIQRFLGPPRQTGRRHIFSRFCTA